MADIFIGRPLQLSMQILEIEGQTPSMRMGVDAELRLSHEVLGFSSNSFWFDCREWDCFTNALTSICSGETAVLADISQNLTLTLRKRSLNVFVFEFVYSQKNAVPTQVSAEMAFSAQIDSDVFAPIARAFQDFPGWW